MEGKISQESLAKGVHVLLIMFNTQNMDTQIMLAGMLKPSLFDASVPILSLEWHIEYRRFFSEHSVIKTVCNACDDIIAVYCFYHHFEHSFSRVLDLNVNNSGCHWIKNK